MVFRGAELEYYNYELLRGQSHVINVTQRSETAGNITISCNTSLCVFSGCKLYGSIIFDIRGQHEVFEVKVINDIRTIINCPFRPLLVHAVIRAGVSTEENNGSIYNLLEFQIRSTPKNDILVLIGDGKAKIEHDMHPDWICVAWYGETNGRGLRLLEFAQYHELFILLCVPTKETQLNRLRGTDNTIDDD